MKRQFDETCRRTIMDCCAAFTREETVTTQNLKRAAVAIVIVPADNDDAFPSFLLTRRAASLRAHGGQWALPGGRCDEGESSITTALRELEEEIGLTLTEQEVIGVLDDYPTRSGYLITPVVLWGGSAPTLSPNPEEVRAVYRIPLADIEPDDAVSFISIEQSDRPVIRLRINGDFVHAPTAAMLYQFREVLAGRPTRVAHLEQPVFAWR